MVIKNCEDSTAAIDTIIEAWVGSCKDALKKHETFLTDNKVDLSHYRLSTSRHIVRKLATNDEPFIGGYLNPQCKSPL